MHIQVSIQLKPSTVKVESKIRLPTTVSEEDEDDFEDLEEEEEDSTSWSAVDGEEGSSSSYFETETDTEESDET